MAIDWDCSISRESAERRLNVNAGAVDLGTLAQRMSEKFYPDEMISVRDCNQTTWKTSGVYLAGKLLADRKPYNVVNGFCVQV